MNQDPLFTAHAVAAVLHGVQAIAAGAILSTQPAKPFPLTTGAYGRPGLQCSANHIPYLIPTFSALSAVNHSWACLDWKGYQASLAGEVDGAVGVRWAEYGLSAGVMTWVLAQLSGITDVSALTLLLVVNAGMQWVGYMVEKTGDPEGYWTVAGFALFAAIWVPIVTNFFVSLRVATDEGFDVPTLVYAIIFVELSLFLTFGVVSAVSRQRLRRNSKNGNSLAADRLKLVRQREFGYIALSLVSKSLLTWMAVGGALNAGPGA